MWDDVTIFPAGLEETDSHIGKSGLKGARSTGCSGEKHHSQHEGHAFNLRYSAGWNINEALRSSFAKRRSRIRPSILRPAPPEWTKVLLAHRLHSLGVSFTTTRATEFAFSVPQRSGCTITSEASSENVLSCRRSNIISWNNPLVLTSRKVRVRSRR